jgi:putative protease
MSEGQLLRCQKGLEYFSNSGNINPMEVKIGTISHVYKKIGVAIVELIDPLQAGDTIHISGHHTDLTQKVDSMQLEHQNVQKADRGQSVGLKVSGEVREHDLVYKVVV